MKLHLDTSLKTIQVEEAINLGELYTLLDTLIPNGMWKSFTLSVGKGPTTFVPVLVPNYKPYGIRWWDYPYIQYSNDSIGLNQGTFTLSIQSTDVPVRPSH